MQADVERLVTHELDRIGRLEAVLRTAGQDQETTELLEELSSLRAWILARSFFLEPRETRPARLLEQLSDPDFDVRCRAKADLIALGPRTDVVLALWPALAITDCSAARCGIAYVLGRLGPGARSAVPALLLALRDPSCWVRLNAVIALGRIGGHGIAKQLDQVALEDPAPPVRQEAQAAAAALRGAVSTAKHQRVLACFGAP